jgi:hypothetical protein
MFGIYGYGGSIGVINMLLGISCCIYYSVTKPQQSEPTNPNPKSFSFVGNPTRDLKAKFLPPVLFLSGMTSYFFGGHLAPFVALQQFLDDIVIIYLVLIDFKDNSDRQ